MASNKSKIIQRYGDGTREENRSSGSRSDYNMEYKYTKRILDNYIKHSDSVLELGCGTGYYGVYLSDKCSKYVGIDIVPGNIEIFNKKIDDLNLHNVVVEVGDATNIELRTNNKYDVVLALGPMYHLPPDEVQKVFEECNRLCKKDGLILVTYITKIGVYLNACLKNPNEYPNTQKNNSIFKQGIDDSRDSIYWFFSPEEIENLAKVNNLEIIDNLGVDFTFIPEYNSEMFENTQAWEELVDFMCSSKSNTGFANHAVMICRKS